MTVAALVATTAPTVDEIVAAHAALRAKRPLVQALTNTVSSNFVANVLLSAGASPAMVDNPEEAALFAGVADAVLINLGTSTAAGRIDAAPRGGPPKGGQAMGLGPHRRRRPAMARASGRRAVKVQAGRGAGQRVGNYRPCRVGRGSGR